MIYTEDSVNIVSGLSKLILDLKEQLDNKRKEGEKVKSRTWQLKSAGKITEQVSNNILYGDKLDEEE